MADDETGEIWPIWRKIIFRFLFIYFILQTTPWNWIDDVPGVYYITRYPDKLIYWLVEFTNANLFHIRPTLVPINGSSDTSFAWARLSFAISVSAIVCFIWSLMDRLRRNYTELNYWLCLFVRYFVILNCFIYGLEKLFALQMPFPNLHQLATPLGDFLPMRLSWMFLGYSKKYQIFSGCMEVLAGCFLLYRPTVTLGILIAAGVFFNVMMLNLSYDIPVKLHAINIVTCCIFLLANDGKRMISFFLLNKPVPATKGYRYNYAKKWMRVSRMVLKVVFILLFVLMQFFNDYSFYKQDHNTAAKQPFKNGIYNVTSFIVSKNGKPLAMADSVRWQDMIFENGTASVKALDTTFRLRYQRSYFFFTTNFKTKVIDIRKLQDDTAHIMHLTYAVADSAHVKLSGLYHQDSIFVNLARINHPFKLTELQFHWLSEHNR